MASRGMLPPAIAARYGLPLEGVLACLARPSAEELEAARARRRDERAAAAESAREARRATAPRGGRLSWIRRMAARGFTVAELVDRYDVSESEVIRCLADVARPRRDTRRNRVRPSQALPPEELARRQAERAAAAAAREAERVAARAERARERARRRWWGEEEPAEPWRHREPEAPAEASADDLGDDQVDQPGAITAAELVDVVGREPEPWAGPVSPHAAPRQPRQIPADVIARALELRSLGLSWPAIAERVDVGRMTLRRAIDRQGPPPAPSPAPLERAPAKVRATPPATSDDDW